MKLIVGLGNPGKKYSQTWHNLGFEVLTLLRQELNLAEFKKSIKFKAEITKGEFNGETIILAKPQTFMNNSGLTVTAIAHYFKIAPTDIIVIHDDLDLPLGKIRLTHNSSAGGHNGIKSIIEHITSQEFSRIKLGIKTELLEKIDPADYVLTNWLKNSQEVSGVIKTAAEAAEEIIISGLTKATNKYN
jgi:PTH1 family peptidyl-tRNA hydrolase